MRKMKTALPTCHKKRAAVLIAYTEEKRIPASPAVKTMNGLSKRSTKPSPEEACVNDIANNLQLLKLKRDDQSRATMKLLTTVLQGEKVKTMKCAKNLAEKLGVNKSRMARARTTILHSGKSVFEYVKRNTRNDSICESVKKLAFEFWPRAEHSRPSNNKNDIKRVRLD